MFDYSCPPNQKQGLDFFVHPGASWNPYDRYLGEAIVLNWTVLYDEPTEALLIGPNSNFSVVRVGLNKGTVVSVEYMVDDEAKAFLDQYECPPDQIIGLYGRNPLGQIKRQSAPAEVQTLASIIESRSSRVEKVLKEVAARKVVEEAESRRRLLQTIEARRHQLQSIKSPSQPFATSSEVVKIPPLVTTSFAAGAASFVGLSVVSVAAGIGAALVLGLGAGIAVLCVVVMVGGFLTLRGMRIRNEKKASLGPHLLMGNGQIIVPLKEGESVRFDISQPFDMQTDWRMLRGNDSVSYQTRTLLTQGSSRVVFYSLDPVNKDSLEKMGFLGFGDAGFDDVRDSASFGLDLSDQLRVWRYLKSTTL